MIRRTYYYSTKKLIFAATNDASLRFRFRMPMRRPTEGMSREEFEEALKASGRSNGGAAEPVDEDGVLDLMDMVIPEEQVNKNNLFLI